MSGRHKQERVCARRRRGTLSSAPSVRRAPMPRRRSSPGSAIRRSLRSAQLVPHAPAGSTRAHGRDASCADALVHGPVWHHAMQNAKCRRHAWRAAIRFTTGVHSHPSSEERRPYNHTKPTASLPQLPRPTSGDADHTGRRRGLSGGTEAGRGAAPGSNFGTGTPPQRAVVCCGYDAAHDMPGPATRPRPAACRPTVGSYTCNGARRRTVCPHVAPRLCTGYTASLPLKGCVRRHRPVAGAIQRESRRPHAPHRCISRGWYGVSARQVRRHCGRCAYGEQTQARYKPGATSSYGLPT